MLHKQLYAFQHNLSFQHIYLSKVWNGKNILAKRLSENKQTLRLQYLIRTRYCWWFTYIIQNSKFHIKTQNGFHAVHSPHLYIAVYTIIHTVPSTLTASLRWELLSVFLVLLFCLSPAVLCIVLISTVQIANIADRYSADMMRYTTPLPKELYNSI